MTFYFAGSYPTVANPAQVAVADVNGDGKADLMVFNHIGMSVMLGRGDGTFGPPQVIAGSTQTIQYVNDFSLADLNRDGKPDFVLRAADHLEVWLGNGDATFRLAQTIPSPNGFSFVTPTRALDINGDGKLDWIVGVESQTDTAIDVLIGNGDGTFQLPRLLEDLGASVPPQIATADFNGDGKPDLLVVHGTTALSVDVFLNNGDGTFRAGGNLDAQFNYGFPTTVAIGDVNGDGKADIVVSGSRVGGAAISDGSGGTFLAVGNGDGTFQASRFLNLNFGSNGTLVALSDLNGDGKADLVAVGSSSMFVAQGNGDGTFQTPLAYGLGQTVQSIGATVGVTIGDVNGDGKPDVITTRSVGLNVNQVRVYLNGRNPSPEEFAVGAGNGRVQIRRGGDSALVADFAPFGSAYAGPINLAWGDVNGDDFRDLVIAAGTGNPAVKVYDGKAIAQGTFNAASPDANLLASFFAFGLNFNVGATVAVGDIEHVGFADIVVGASAGNPQVKVYRGQAIAGGTFDSQNPDASLLASYFSYGLGFNIGVNVAVGDLLGNGHADIATAPTAGNPEIKIYNGLLIQNVNQMVNPTGSNLLAAWYAYGLGSNLGATVAIGDVEGNGTPDIITGATVGNPDVKVYHMSRVVQPPPGVFIASYVETINYRDPENFKVAEFMAFDQNQNIGVAVGVVDFESAGLADILASPLSGPPSYRVFRLPALVGKPVSQIAPGN